MSNPDLGQGPPLIPQPLVEWLEALWPDKFPSEVLGSDPQKIAADIHHHAGRLEVIRHLREHLTRQTKPKSPKKTR